MILKKKHKNEESLSSKIKIIKKILARYVNCTRTVYGSTFYYLIWGAPLKRAGTLYRNRRNNLPPKLLRRLQYSPIIHLIFTCIPNQKKHSIEYF